MIEILDSLRDDPVYEAINAGRPERMGEADGWDEARFRADSTSRCSRRGSPRPERDDHREDDR